jgi:cytochrome c oxidase cbb3-type subunit 3
VIAMRRAWCIGLASIALALASGCDSLPGTPKPSDRPVAPQEIKDFAELYGHNCAGCHGADGSFGAATPLNNATYLALVDDSSLRRTIVHGVSGTSMPPLAISEGGSLTDEQIAILIAGMRKRWSRPIALAASAPPYSDGTAGNSQAGAKVYSTDCASCHGMDGTGGVDAGSIVDGSYLSLTSDQSIRTTIIAGRPDLGHPDWRGYPTPLSAQQVSDVVEWIIAKRRHTTAPDTASMR